YRIAKMPGRIALIVRELSNVHELQRGLTKLHDRVGALSWHVSALQEQQEKVLTLVERTAQQAATASRVGESGPASGATKPSLPTLSDGIEARLDKLSSTQVQTHQLVADTSHTVIALHEKCDRFQQDLSARVAGLNPVVHAGENLVISRIDDFIMAFPAEE